MRELAIIFLLLILSGCGTVHTEVVNNYYIIGDSNKVSQTVRTNSKPDITADTNASASIPASVIP